MSERNVSLILVLLTGAMLALIFSLSNRDEPIPSRADQLSRDIGAYAPSAAGKPSSVGVTDPTVAQQPKDGYVGGTRATGRVAEIYLKVGQGVFLSMDRAPETLRKTAERWVDVQFPDLLANGAGAARAFISDAQASVGVGDIVEIRFAHKSGKDTAQFFPVKEITRVTELVAKSNEMLARDYEQRILARISSGGSRQTQLSSAPGTAAAPAWLQQSAVVSPPPAVQASAGQGQTTAASSR
jgi:hypothetical protein